MGNIKLSTNKVICHNCENMISKSEIFLANNGAYYCSFNLKCRKVGMKHINNYKALYILIKLQAIFLGTKIIFESLPKITEEK